MLKKIGYAILALLAICIWLFIGAMATLHATGELK